MEKIGEQRDLEDRFGTKDKKKLQGTDDGMKEREKNYSYFEETERKVSKSGRNQISEQSDTYGEDRKEGEKKKSLNKLKSFLSRKDNLILVILGGILCMMIALPVGTKQETIGTGENTLGFGNSDTYISGQQEGKAGNTKYQSGIEKRLEELLLQTEGCEQVRVMITFEEGKSDGVNQYDYSFTYPKINGIVVCINNGDDPRIAEKVTAYIQALFSVEAHKIRVANIKTSAYGG